MKKMIKYPAKQLGAILESVSYIILIFIGIFDYLTGTEVAFTLLYLAPIFVVTWLRGRRKGIAVSVASAIIWLAGDYFTRAPYPHLAIFLWNASVVPSLFLIITLLLSALKKALEAEEKLARTDPLTRISNRRAFFESANHEIARARRYGRSLSAVFIDLDNFKAFNDAFGHVSGDAVLRRMARTIKEHIRSTDIVARLGGDEFIIMLPENDHKQTHSTITRIHRKLSDVMQKNTWPVTFSFGAITFRRPPGSVDEMIKRADDLMYSGKKRNKNTIQIKEIA